MNRVSYAMPDKYVFSTPVYIHSHESAFYGYSNTVNSLNKMSQQVAERFIILKDYNEQAYTMSRQQMLSVINECHKIESIITNILGIQRDKLLPLADNLESNLYELLLNYKKDAQDNYNRTLEIEKKYDTIVENANKKVMAALNKDMNLTFAKFEKILNKELLGAFNNSIGSAFSTGTIAASAYKKSYSKNKNYVENLTNKEKMKDLFITAIRKNKLPDKYLNALKKELLRTNYEIGIQSEIEVINSYLQKLYNIPLEMTDYGALNTAYEELEKLRRYSPKAIVGQIGKLIEPISMLIMSKGIDSKVKDIKQGVSISTKVIPSDLGNIFHFSTSDGIIRITYPDEKGINHTFEIGVSIKFTHQDGEAALNMANKVNVIVDSSVNTSARIARHIIDSLPTDANILRLFRYLIYNYKALSVVAYPPNYPWFNPGVDPEPSHSSVNMSNIDVLSPLKRAIDMNAAIKFLVGAAFTGLTEDELADDGLQEVLEKKHLPILVRVDRKDLWTSDILQSILSIMDKSNKKGETENNIMSSIYDDPMFSNFTEQNLVELFVAKKLVPSTMPGGNRIADIYADSHIQSMLESLSAGIPNDDKTFLKQLLTKSTLKNIKVSELIK